MVQVQLFIGKGGQVDVAARWEHHSYRAEDNRLKVDSYCLLT